MVSQFYIYISSLALLIVFMQATPMIAEEGEGVQTINAESIREWQRLTLIDLEAYPLEPGQIASALDELYNTLLWNHLQEGIYTREILFAQFRAHQRIMNASISSLLRFRSDGIDAEKYREVARMALRIDSFWVGKLARLQVSFQTFEPSVGLLTQLGTIATDNGLPFAGVHPPDQIPFKTAQDRSAYIELFNHYRRELAAEALLDALNHINKLRSALKESHLNTLSSWKDWISATDIAEALSCRGLSQVQRRDIWQTLSDLRGGDLPLFEEFEFVPVQMNSPVP